ncbi:gp58-like family protein [Streptococcus pseudopneumoniae]|uniref:gp58-like family protein n=1 Tax=Streptococcus pseudopneumoniae TaxID=257758 RepID=UPI00069EE73D|nr:tail fiber domain-containing protein [Streptococcus pseudopneumoniae]
MDITIQNVRSPALEHNGRYYKVFQPRTRDELLKLHHMGCVGDTVLTDIQLEQGDFPTSFVEPTVTQRTLSGLFKDMRSIELELTDPNSTLWGKIQQNNKGALTQFFDENVKSAIAQTAKEIRQEVRDAANSARVQVTPEGVTIGSTTLTGEQLASTISASPRGVDIIAPRVRVKSDMIVDGAVTAGKLAAGSVTADTIKAGAITGDKISVDDALIKNLTARDALIDKLTSKEIFTTKIESVVSSSTFLQAYQGEIGGFTLGQFDNGGGRWISGVNQFSVGMGNGAGYGTKTAFWANWGGNWNQAGPNSWHVDTDGQMYCKNTVSFYGKVDFSGSTNVNFYSKINVAKGIWTGNADIYGAGSNPAGGDNAVCWWNQITTAKWRGYAGITSSSDKRLKENIKESPVNALDKIQALNMVSFDFIESQKYEEIGLIAQEAQKVVPEAIEIDETTSYLSINYSKFIPYLLKAVQELDQKIKEMENIHG